MGAATSGNLGWPLPNLTLLNHALAQAGRRGPMLTDENRRAVLRERLIMAGRGG